MTPPTSSSNTIILNKPEDWEQWLWQLQALVDKRIWAHVDPTKEAPQQGLLQKPPHPEVTDFNAGATSYAQLSTNQQKAYDNSRRYYDQDMKYFLRQEDHLQQIRTQITSTVSIQKKLLLDPSLTVKEWLSRLKENTEPTSSFVRKKVQHQYTEALKGFKHLSKLNQWLDQWEHAMMLGEKYKIPQMSDGIWLQDLAEVIQPFSDAYCMKYTTESNDPQKSRSSEYRRVAKELQEGLRRLSEKANATTRGSTFNTDFAEQAIEDHSDTTKGSRRGKASARKSRLKRAGSLVEETSQKKPTPECLACGIRGHSLRDCWCLFKDKRPAGVTIKDTHIKKALRKVEQNKDLADLVAKIRLEQEDEA